MPFSFHKEPEQSIQTVANYVKKLQNNSARDIAKTLEQMRKEKVKCWYCNQDFILFDALNVSNLRKFITCPHCDTTLVDLH